MYITVRYGDRKQEIFNPNCKTYLLLKSIKKKCKCGFEVDIDLSDESGNIKNLREPASLSRYANELLDDRERLVLLKVERRSPDGSHYSYTPMLQDDEAISDDFLARLALKDPDSRPESRRVKSNTRRPQQKAPENHQRLNSRERTNDKTKSTKSDKRLSARSKR